MTRKSFEIIVRTALVGALLGPGCASDGPAPTQAGSSTTTATTTATGPGDESVTSTSEGSGGPQTSSGSSSSDGEDGADDATFIHPGSDGGDTGEPQPTGSPCTSNNGCTSGFCFLIPAFGGVCSDCLVDEDCDTGTCGLDFELGYALCTDGSLGKMCSSDEGCMGRLVCAELIDTGGLFPLNFCSECETDATCDPGQICAPHYDEGAISGWQECADVASVPNGQGCPLGASGEGEGAVCEGGHCGVAGLFMNLLQIGLCGECSSDADCVAGQTCVPPSTEQGGLAGAACL